VESADWEPFREIRSTQTALLLTSCVLPSVWQSNEFVAFRSPRGPVNQADLSNFLIGCAERRWILSQSKTAKGVGLPFFLPPEKGVPVKQASGLIENALQSPIDIWLAIN